MEIILFNKVIQENYKFPDKLRVLHIEFCSNFSVISVFPSSLKEFYLRDIKLSQLPDLPDNLKVLSCVLCTIELFPRKFPKKLDVLILAYIHNNSYSKYILPKFPNNLKIFKINNVKFYKLPKFPNSLKKISIYGIEKKYNFPKDLKVLDIVFENDIKSFSIPKKLEELNCSFSDLITLPILPKCLKRLNCQGNHLTSLPKLPEGLEELNCNSNKLTSINLYKNLKVLNISYNIDLKLDSNFEFPKKLEELYCNDCYLTILPDLPESLKKLYCYCNKLTSLPKLPKNLEELYCYSNCLTELPKLSEKLKLLDCGYNELIKLPQLPEGLIELYCHDASDTKIYILPHLPVGLKYLRCGYMWSFYMNYNMNISTEIDKFKKHYNALIKFQKMFRNYLWSRDMTLKKICKRYIVNSDEEFILDQEIIPLELIDYVIDE